MVSTWGVFVWWLSGCWLGGYCFVYVVWTLGIAGVDQWPIRKRLGVHRANDSLRLDQPQISPYPYRL